MAYKKVDIYCDGGSRGNPGPSAGGVVIYGDGEIIGEYSKYYGINTNNYAEYSAVILGLIELKKLGLQKGSFLLDSLLVVNQLNGVFRVKHPNIIPLYKRVKELSEGLDVSFTHVYREDNTAADAMVNKCLDSQKS